MTVADMLHVEPLETRSHSDNQLAASSSQSRGKRKPYQAQHPHSQHHHHRRQRAPEPEPEPEIQVDVDDDADEESVTSPDANPNDPFEQHFLAAAARQSIPSSRDKSSTSLMPVQDGKIRSSSFRNDKPKPHVQKRDTELANSSNFSSSPNLLFPKDDLHIDTRHHEHRDAPLRRVRSFKSTSKGGVVSRGDSLRRKGSNKNVHSGSINGYDSPRLTDSYPAGINKKPTASAAAADEPIPSYFKVQVLGPPGCGKTSITNQFMSSEYANSFEGMNVDDAERTVTIQLDGEESTMEFIDALPWDDKEDHDIEITADAYIVVYSVIDRTTFDAAVQSLYKLRHNMFTDRAIALVGNKVDLVRKRKVKKDDVLSICRTYDCLHFETSAALNHRVDDLLVDLLKQIRHKLNPTLYASPDNLPKAAKEDSKGAKGFLVKLYRRLSRKGRPKSKKN